MNPRSLAILALVLMSAVPSGANAQGPSTPVPNSRASLLVTTEFVAEHLKDPDLVILHVGDPAKYAGAHLPGARQVSFVGSGFAQEGPAPDSLVLELPPPELLKTTLEGLGVSDRSRIVIYQAQQYFSPATRLLFTLTWAGLGARVSLMDGGLATWIREGRLTTKEAPAIKPGHLSPLKTQPIVASLADVQSAAGKKVSIVDGRDAGFYDGTMAAGRDDAPVRGHIPGARSVPFSSVWGDDEKLKPEAELREIFSKAGVKAGNEIIGYCHIGQQATSMLFAARSLGFNTRLFDGSMDEWTKKGLPLESVKK